MLGRSWAKKAGARTDAAGVRRLQTGWDRVHVCIDDATRLAYVEVLADEKTATVIGFLRRAVAFYRSHGVVVERLMTDNGPAIAPPPTRCPGSEIKHIHTLLPAQTNGKAERFIRTMLREWAYAAATAAQPREPRLSRAGSSATTSRRHGASVTGRQ